MDDRVQQNQTQFDISQCTWTKPMLTCMECTSESLGAVLRAFCPCGLVRQALTYILRGVRIGADRVKITLFLRGAEWVHVNTVYEMHRVGCPAAPSMCALVLALPRTTNEKGKMNVNSLYCLQGAGMVYRWIEEPWNLVRSYRVDTIFQSPPGAKC